MIDIKSQKWGHLVHFKQAEESVLVLLFILVTSRNGMNYADTCKFALCLHQLQNSSFLGETHGLLWPRILNFLKAYSAQTHRSAYAKKVLFTSLDFLFRKYLSGSIICEITLKAQY